MKEGILSLIGNTPLLKLSRFLPEGQIRLYAKLENMNPGGSIKDRPAIRMITEALDSGQINRATTIVESTSGNLGIGLAQACAYLGLRFVCVTDARCTPTNRRMLEAYGAELIVVEEPDPEAGTFLAARIKRVQELLDAIPNSFNCNQYQNPLNPASHHQTVAEIMAALPQGVDYIFCATSTCGTLRGCAEYIQAHELSTQIIAVDAVGSVIFGDTPKPRLVPGHGAGVPPHHFEPGLEDQHRLVTDVDCIVGCRRLMRREAIFAGGSSGAIMYAIESMQHELPAGSTCVAILADRGGRYLDTIYNDDWVIEHFGDISDRLAERTVPPLAEPAGKHFADIA